MKKKVTREGVELAIQQIEANGEKPTIERIRAITGGSPKTIGEIKNTLNRGDTDRSTLPLFDNVATVSLSYHNITEKVDAMITQRIDNLVMRRLDSVLSRLEDEPQEKNLPATNASSETQGLTEALGEMRELWLEVCDLFISTKDELLATQARVAELETEGRSHNDKGERVYKSELALAVRHLVMTAGMSQKDVGELLGLNANEVSQLKNKGTKLNQKRAKSG